MSKTLHIGFLGAGKMATALAKGFVAAGITRPEFILASDVAPAALASFTRETGAQTASSNRQVAEKCTVLVIAVKPDQVVALLQEISPQIQSHHLIVSIAAGVPLARLEAALPASTRVVRVMPNTPALVGASATGFALGKSATPDDATLATTLFNSVGIGLQVKESLLDAVTGLSGSGPAYVYMIIEALSDGGVAAGLPRDVATRLAAQTLLGGARMVLETGIHPGALKDMVTSPGGTTIEGVHELEKAGLRAALINAVRAATAKSQALGK